MAKLKAATVILDRAGLTERAALEDEQRRRRAESDRVRYLNDLEDPMSVVSLVGGVI